MRYIPAFLLVVLIVGSIYLRVAQPTIWNDVLTALRAPDGSAPIATPVPVVAETPPPVSPPAPEVPKVETPPAPAPAPAPAPTPAPVVGTASHPFPAQPNWTWSTSNGTIYRDVVIQKIEPDAVTILHHDGGAKIDMANLPPDIQAQLNYDPAAAKAYAAAEAAREAAADAELAREKQKAEHDAQLLAERQAAPQQAPAAGGAPVLSDEAKAQMQQQISDLKKDIRQKLGEMASVYATDGYAKAVSSQSSFRETVMEESDQVNTLEDKLGVPHTPEPRWFPYYPYYFY